MAASDEVHEFVRNALTIGSNRAAIEAALVDAGWGVARAKAAIAEFADVAFPIPVPRPRPHLDARDAFLYVVLFSTLYVSAFNLGLVVFEFINRTFPDAAFQMEAAYAVVGLRWAIASLIIAAPVFLFVSGRVQRAISHDPAKRGSQVRRWLTYLTLAIASGIIIGDFITLIYYALSGELSSRFVLKVATVAVIGGGVFLFYLWDVNVDEKDIVEKNGARRISAVAWAAAAAAAVAGGWLMAGSPAEARLLRLDDQRVSDLRRIASAVDLYRTRVGTLPATLDAVSTQGAWQAPPRDPASGQAYEYRIVTDARYEVCATFDRASDGARASWNTDVFQAHTARRQCFPVDVPVNK